MVWVRVWIGSSDNLIQQNIFQNSKGGVWAVAATRSQNVLLTVVPCITTFSQNYTNALRVNAFSSVAGMLGFVFLPFYAAILLTRRGRLIAQSLLLLPTIVSAAIMGNVVNRGVAPFGPFLYCPIAVAFGCGALARWRPRLRSLVAFLATVEQAGLFWLFYRVHWDLIDVHRTSHLAKVAVVVVTQITVAAVAIYVSLRESGNASSANGSWMTENSPG